MASKQFLDRVLAEEEIQKFTITDIGSGESTIEDTSVYEQNGTHLFAADYIDIGVLECDHTKAGTVHELTNPNTIVKSFRFIASGDFESGDSFTFNGVDLELLGEEPSFEVGFIVTGTINGTTVNFKTGGGGLNYKVIAVASSSALPANAKENTIAVVTSAPITSHHFRETAPEISSLTAGAVWIRTIGNSSYPFDAIKKNEIQTNPVKTSIWDGAAWNNVASYIYQNNQWYPLNYALYYLGEEYENITQGWTVFNPHTYSMGTVTKNDESITVTCAASSSAGIAPPIKIDLTDIATLWVNIIDFVGAGTTSNLLVSTTRNTSSFNNRVKVITIQDTGTLSSDVSDLTGEYYVIMMTQGSTARSFTFDRVWGEYA